MRTRSCKFIGAVLAAGMHLIGSQASAAALTVEAGEVYRPDPGKTCTSLSELVLKTGSRVLIGSEDVCLDIGKLFVGADVLIAAFGAGERTAAQGAVGGSGDNGRNAGNLTLSIGTLVLTDDAKALRIDLSGQDGGAGGPGVAGQQGSPGADGKDAAISCHRAKTPDGPELLCSCRQRATNGEKGGTGAAGGDGGLGGSGGNGGNASIKLANGDPQAIVAVSHGGAGGHGGPGGAGGGAGPGGRGGQGADECGYGRTGDNGDAGPSGLDRSTTIAPGGVDGKISLNR